MSHDGINIKQTLTHTHSNAVHTCKCYLLTLAHTHIHFSKVPTTTIYSIKSMEDSNYIQYKGHGGLQLYTV